MNKISLILLIIFLVINVVIGLLLSCYSLFNVLLNSIVLGIGIILTYWSNEKSIASAFRISLAFFVPTITLIEFVLGLLSPTHVQDNGYIIAIICCVAFELLFIYAVTRISKLNQ